MKKKIATLLTITALGALSSVAQAATLTGIFNVDIYTYNAGGVAANADATEANLAGKTLTASGTYIGALDFFTTGSPSPTVAGFLGSGTGAFSLGVGDASGQMTSGTFQTTTLFDFTSNFTGGFAGNIQHDDGISLYDDGVLITGASAAKPTANGDTDYAFSGGDFRLVYSAANGNPEELNVDVSAVPLPAAAWLFGSALLGLVAVKRRKL